MSTPGLLGAGRRVRDHVRQLVRLELELAAAEVKEKLSKVATGVGLVVAALMVAFFAVAFGLGAAAAGLAEEMPIWAALLVMFAFLGAIASILAAVGAQLIKKGSPPVPEQAIEEARITQEALRNGH
jgi:hypothetical protein